MRRKRPHGEGVREEDPMPPLLGSGKAIGPRLGGAGVRSSEEEGETRGERSKRFRKDTPPPASNQARPSDAARLDKKRKDTSPPPPGPPTSEHQTEKLLGPQREARASQKSKEGRKSKVIPALVETRKWSVRRRNRRPKNGSQTDSV